MRMARLGAAACAHSGCVENELGLRQFLEERGHTYVVTDDKEGPDCELERHLPDADIVSAFLPSLA